MKIPGPNRPDGSLNFYRIASLLLLLSSISSALKLLGFNRVYRFLDRTGRRRESEFDKSRQLTEARRTAAILQQVSHGYSLFGSSCLAESLALLWLLSRRGIKARFQMGVRTLTGVFESHAWVEYDGHVLNEVDNAGEIFAVFELRSLRRP